jgi:DNA (cytosine-5)-methyltransferase 1
MIGNAVPVKLAEYVAQSLLMYIQDKIKYQISDICLVTV